MQFARIDNNGIYQGLIGAISASLPDVGYYAPQGIRVSTLGAPPTDQPGKWRDAGTGWIETTLESARAAKRLQINAGFDSAIAASLTMPSRQTPPSAVEIALAIEDFKSDDTEGWQTLRAVHLARRTALLAALAATKTAVEVDSIVVSYAV